MLVGQPVKPYPAIASATRNSSSEHGHAIAFRYVCRFTTPA